jgi:subtilisin family serine protease
VLVASAGNDGIRFDVTEEGALGVFPASFPGVVTVGGAARDGRWWRSANYGPGLDLVAPAHEVRTLTYDPADPSQTAASATTASGTSLSAAFVSGTAAVILTRYPETTAPRLLLMLRAKATDILDPLGDGSSHVGDDEWTGAGLLNAGAATTALANPNDQPVVVELQMGRSKNFRGYYGWGFPARPFAVGGEPTS